MCGKTENRANYNVAARHAVPACSTYRNIWVCLTVVTRSPTFTTLLAAKRRPDVSLG